MSSHHSAAAGKYHALERKVRLGSDSMVELSTVPRPFREEELPEPHETERESLQSRDAYQGDLALLYKNKSNLSPMLYSSLKYSVLPSVKLRREHPDGNSKSIIYRSLFKNCYSNLDDNKYKKSLSKFHDHIMYLRNNVPPYTFMGRPDPVRALKYHRNAKIVDDANPSGVSWLPAYCSNWKNARRSPACARQGSYPPASSRANLPRLVAPSSCPSARPSAFAATSPPLSSDRPSSRPSGPSPLCIRDTIIRSSRLIILVCLRHTAIFRPI